MIKWEIVLKVQYYTYSLWDAYRPQKNLWRTRFWRIGIEIERIK